MNNAPNPQETPVEEAEIRTEPDLSDSMFIDSMFEAIEKSEGQACV